MKFWLILSVLFLSSVTPQRKLFNFKIIYNSSLCGECVHELSAFFKSKKVNYVIAYKDYQNTLANVQTESDIRSKYKKNKTIEKLNHSILEQYKDSAHPFVMSVNTKTLDTSYFFYKQLFIDSLFYNSQNWDKLFFGNR